MMVVYDAHEPEWKVRQREYREAIEAQRFMKSHYQDVWLRAAMEALHDADSLEAAVMVDFAFEVADEFLKQYKERVEGQTNDQPL